MAIGASWTVDAGLRCWLLLFSSGSEGLSRDTAAGTGCGGAARAYVGRAFPVASRIFRYIDVVSSRYQTSSSVALAFQRLDKYFTSSFHLYSPSYIALHSTPWDRVQKRRRKKLKILKYVNQTSSRLNFASSSNMSVETQAQGRESQTKAFKLHRHQLQIQGYLFPLILTTPDT